jgi:hypothetical protein
MKKDHCVGMEEAIPCFEFIAELSGVWKQDILHMSQTIGENG